MSVHLPLRPTVTREQDDTSTPPEAKTQALPGAVHVLVFPSTIPVFYSEGHQRLYLER